MLYTEHRLFLASSLPATELNRKPVSGNYRRDSMGGYNCPRQNILLMYYVYTHHRDENTRQRNDRYVREYTGYTPT